MKNKEKLKIAIIGAGFTGLTAAYELGKAGHKVTVFEKKNFAGGLAAGIKVKEGFTSWRDFRGWDLEGFQHHFFVNDTEAFSLIDELGLNDKLLKLSPKTSILYKDKLYRFDTPLSLLTFPHLSVLKKSKLAAAIAFLKLNSNWRALETQTADAWWRKKVGEDVYKMIWEPLLQGKFGDYYSEINMAWFWARIKKRTQKLCYLKGGFQVLVDKLIKEIKKQGGKVRLDHQITRIETLPATSLLHIANGPEQGPFQKLIVTTPPLTLVELVPNLPADYKKWLSKLRGLGAQALILFLNKQFLTDGTYWLNVNDASYPFLSVVEHTNFIDPKHYGGSHIIYVGNYLPLEHPYMQMSKEELLKEFGPYLSRINQQFNNLTMKQSFLVRAKFAQPIVPVNHSQNIPSLQTPIPNVYYASMSQVYPWDRGVNYAIEMGQRVARVIET
ncbi:MAG: NAD(P)/FAD-dependent oxidoreductase [Candidatus Cloacimonetes bacterium]|nr:NAD(P)/FAD-dependent oxidoreductase [Candidatus Cloacimonadota bacterium]